MAKTTFNQGTIVPTSWFNAIQDIKFDLEPGDEPFNGRYEKLGNSSLLNESGHVRYDYYNFKNQFKASINSGLVVDTVAGFLTDKNGYQLTVPNRSITVPNNKTSFISLNPNGQLVVGDDLIYLNLPIARVVSSGGIITSLTDIRPYYRLSTTPSVTKVIGGTGDEGIFNSVGNSTFDKGVYFFDKFTLNNGHTINVKDFVKIYCADDFILNGEMIVNASVAGGGGLQTGTISGLNIGKVTGNGQGGGGSVPNNDYNWQLSPVGSGGSSGIVTADVTATGQSTQISSGGFGGGGIVIECAGNIIINGTIRANGSAGTYPTTVGANSLSSGGGGGSGGSIIFLCANKVNLNVSAIVEAKGGAGGRGRRGASCTANATGGGGGGGGQIVMIAPTVTVAVGATTDVTGGLQGTNWNNLYDRSGSALGGGDGGGNGGAGGTGGGNSTPAVHNGANGLITIRQFKPVG